MKVVVAPDASALARVAAELFRSRVRENPEIAMAVPAGRTPRRMYGVMQEIQRTEPVDFSRMRVFSVDELCPPAPPDGYFWRQVRAEFLSWAGVDPARCHPFRVGAPDLEAICEEYEKTIVDAGGLDLVMLGIGPNAHIASNEPGAGFATPTRPVRLMSSTVSYILTDDVIQGEVCDQAVTLGIATILRAREIIVLASGALKREPLRRALEGRETPNVPASVLRRHSRCTILADRDAAP